MIRGWQIFPYFCRMKNSNITLYSCGCKTLSSTLVHRQKYTAYQQEHRLTGQGKNLHEEFGKQKENDHLYSLLQENPKYDSYFLSKYPTRLASDITSLTDCQYHIQKISSSTQTKQLNIIKALLSIAGTSRSDQDQLLMNGKLLDGVHILSSGLSTLSDDELFVSMALISQLYFRKACLFSSRSEFCWNVSEDFSRACEHRHSSWSRRQMLLAADFFFCFMTNRREAHGFLNAVLAKFFNHLPNLDVQELVLLLFHINLMRKMPNYVFEIEDAILNKFSELSPDELAVICLGFFKTNTKIQSQTLIANLGQRYQETSLTLSPFCLSAFQKCFQKSVRKDVSRKNKDFNRAVCAALPQISKRMQELPIPAVMHSLTLYEHIQFVSEEFLHNIYQRILSDDFDNWRLKDISSVISIMSSLQYYGSDSELVFSRFVESINREERLGERRKFIGCLLMGLIGLASYDEYPDQLLDLLFTDINLRNFQGSSLDYAHDLCFLFNSIRIDSPDYQFPLLSEESKQALANDDCLHKTINKVHNVARSQISVREALLLELEQELKHIFIDKDFYKLEFLLPHTQTPDFELRMNSAGRFLPVKEWSSNGDVTKSAPRKSSTDSKSNTDSKSPTDPLSSLLMSLPLDGAKSQKTKIAILLWWPFCYYLLHKMDGKKTLKLLGFYEMKRRQLQRSGYQTIEIPYFEFNKTQNRAEYLQSKLDDAIQTMRGLRDS